MPPLCKGGIKGGLLPSYLINAAQSLSHTLCASSLYTREPLRQGERAKCFILEEEGRAVGYGIICFYYSQEAGGICVLFDELYVRGDFRSRGFGRAYFEYVFKNCPAARYVLEIEPDNVRARALYERLGFKELGYTRMYRD